jgi:DNA-binding NarL/FixJ family response regulator
MDDEPSVVIADDNDAILDVVRDLLSGSFRMVAQVGDGLEAFRAINEHAPQLVVLDISMPKMNGMQVARWLSRATHPTKIVLLTLMTGHDFIRDAKRYGHGFVAKPRLHSDLVPALYAAIEGEFFLSDLNNPQTEA